MHHSAIGVELARECDCLRGIETIGRIQTGGKRDLCASLRDRADHIIARHAPLGEPDLIARAQTCKKRLLSSHGAKIRTIAQCQDIAQLRCDHLCKTLLAHSEPKAGAHNIKIRILRLILCLRQFQHLQITQGI